MSTIFCIALNSLSTYVCIPKREEVNIAQKSTNQKFARCNNTKCGAFFIFDPRVILGEAGMLCPSCRAKMDTHHMVQCQSCESLIDFREAEPSEEPVIFYVQKCSHCTGSREDERRVVPYYFPDAYI